MILNILNKLFRREEINGANRCPTYLYRWLLLSTKLVGIYLHHFVGDDWSLDMHDHPKRFVSIGLSGGYTEHTPRGSKDWSAPWVRSFPANHIHRLSLGKHKECWTLIIVFSAVRPWGFWHDGVWIPWREYVTGKSSGIADKMKSCADV